MNKQPQGLKQWETYADLYHQGEGLAGDNLHNNLIQPILDDFLGDYSGVTIQAKLPKN